CGISGDVTCGISGDVTCGISGDITCGINKQVDEEATVSQVELPHPVCIVWGRAFVEGADVLRRGL
ncbi:hypothetical protein, partial [Ralstonia solanacearum]